MEVIIEGEAIIEHISFHNETSIRFEPRYPEDFVETVLKEYGDFANVEKLIEVGSDLLVDTIATKYLRDILLYADLEEVVKLLEEFQS